ncbi:MAG: hypothetical protein AAGD25_32015 [Cyanobacteria bacterium P01_F01_bin.150]
MPKQPQFPKRDINQAAIDAIATKIDSYDQAWERRWIESENRWDIRMERLEASVERIAATGVEEIRNFMGQAAELQVQTQLKLDELATDIKTMNAAWDERMGRMAEAINGYQAIAQEQAKTTQELIRLVTVMAGKIAA